jgi:hypothetical protein
MFKTHATATAGGTRYRKWMFRRELRAVARAKASAQRTLIVRAGRMRMFLRNPHGATNIV